MHIFPSQYHTILLQSYMRCLPTALVRHRVAVRDGNSCPVSPWLFVPARVHGLDSLQLVLLLDTGPTQLLGMLHDLVDLRNGCCKRHLALVCQAELVKPDVVMCCMYR